MIKVQFGATGVTDFNFASFIFEAFVNDNFKMSYDESNVKLYSDKNDYIELKGSFTPNPSEKNPLDSVLNITSFSVVVDGKANYEITGLAISHDILTNPSALSRYLNNHDYLMVGNDLNNKLTSGDGDDTINGGKGNDWLIANGGDDKLIGGTGRDTFFFHKGDGEDTITDFVHSGKLNETIDLSDYGEKISFKDLDISKHGKSDVIIEFGRHDSIILEHVTVKQISAADFDF